MKIVNKCSSAYTRRTKRLHLVLSSINTKRKKVHLEILPFFNTKTTTGLSQDVKQIGIIKNKLLTISNTATKDRYDYDPKDQKLYSNSITLHSNDNDFSHMFNILTLLPQDGIIAFVRELVVNSGTSFGFVQKPKTFSYLNEFRIKIHASRITILCVDLFQSFNTNS